MKYRMITLFKFMVLLYAGSQVLAQTNIRKDGYCVMYGQMAPGTEIVNPYNGPAKNFSEESYKILAETCPHLAHGINETVGCCGIGQLKSLEKNLKTAATLFSRCPSCSKNFYNMWCDFTCSPNQSKFMDYTYGMATYYVSDKYANDLYGSCKDVTFPGSNGKVMDLMCGTTAKLCTTEKFLKFVGTPGNGAPFNIMFNIGLNVSGVENHDAHMVGCNETYAISSDKNSTVCSCQDCQPSCPVPPSPPQPKPIKYIMGIRETYFITGVVLLVWVFVFLAFSVFEIFRSRDSSLEARADAVHSGSVSSNGSGYHNSTTALYGGYQQNPGKCVGLGIKAEEFLQKIFQKWGTLCASHPWKVILVSLFFILVCSLGLLKFTVITNPVELWSSPTTQARMEKSYYDEKFTPFYRTEQVIITSTVKNNTEEFYPYQVSSPTNFSGIMTKEMLFRVLDLQLDLMNLTAEYNGETVALNDICYQPLYPDNKDCAVMSVLQYWQLDAKKLNMCITNMDSDCSAGFGSRAADWHDQFSGCTKNPTAMELEPHMKLPCMGKFGGPVTPKLALGGFEGDDYSTATTLIITFVVNNHRDESKNKKAEAWEKVFIDYLKKWEQDPELSANLTIAYTSERSIQDEITRASESDVLTIAISYCLMFLYIAVGLGQFRSLSRMLIDAKITVGIIGVLIVLLSVAASLGACSYFGTPATLIIIEVIPFLVLAVGVDNIFILVQALQRDIRLPAENTSEQVGRVVGVVGPSMLLSSLSESVAFGFGALSTMPAVHTFAVFACFAVFFNFILQMTMLVAVVTLDKKRQDNSRYDILCCASGDKNAPNSEECCEGGVLHFIVKKIYAPTLMLYPVRVTVILVFSIYLGISACFITNLSLGISQTIALPRDSFLMNYFGNLSTYLKTGAPVYFVVKDGFDYSKVENQNLLCGSSGCNSNSLLGEVFFSSLNPNYTSVALPASSWLDDYFSWLDPDVKCCRLRNGSTPLNMNFCPATDPLEWRNCTSCLPKNESAQRPRPAEFRKFLQQYLKDNPSKDCSKGGHAAYGGAVKLNAPVDGEYSVDASYFMTYHTVSTTSDEFTHSMKYARELASNMTERINHDVFAYSVFYVFYEQYLTIVSDTWKDLLICASGVFAVTFLLMGFNFGLAFCIIVTVAMIVVDLMGLMYLWNISLNAVSLVNLMMAIGISVEFCAHIGRAFSTSPYSSRVKRAEDALGTVGSSVLSGITITKFVGVFVLWFSKSELFEIYYFRMYMGIIIMGFLHGLVFLPVFLSYVGPASRATEEDVKRASMATNAHPAAREKKLISA
ncbi:NPC intracellular cholesterol transporter 1-like [Clytia hemisphaerica]